MLTRYAVSITIESALPCTTDGPDPVGEGALFVENGETLPAAIDKSKGRRKSPRPRRDVARGTRLLSACRRSIRIAARIKENHHARERLQVPLL
jgi:hypothetical protein